MNEKDITIQLNDHEKRISELEVKEAVLGTKLDLTNKLLGGILVVLGTAVVGLMFDVIKNGGLK
jgi:hypothetical protein